MESWQHGLIIHTCPKCGFENPGPKRRCEKCKTWVSSYPQPKHRSGRNAQILRLIKTDHYSMQEIGDYFGVTRQRIQQIYRNRVNRDIPHRDYQRFKHVNRLLADLNRPKFSCQICGVTVTKINGKNKQLYCNLHGYTNSTNIRSVMTNICTFCGQSYHPWKNAEKNRKYCSRRCSNRAQHTVS